MEGVKVWCLSVCVALIVGSIISSIVPSLEKFKIMKLTISAFILVGVLFPLIKGIDDGSFNFNDIEQSIVIETENSKMNDEIIEKLQDNVSQSLFPLVKYELHMLNVSDEFGIKAKIKKEENGVSIQSVNITISDLHKNNKDSIRDTLEKNLGLPIDLEVN